MLMKGVFPLVNLNIIVKNKAFVFSLVLCIVFSSFLFVFAGSVAGQSFSPNGTFDLGGVSTSGSTVSYDYDTGFYDRGDLASYEKHVLKNIDFSKKYTFYWSDVYESDGPFFEIYVRPETFSGGIRECRIEEMHISDYSYVWDGVSNFPTGTDYVNSSGRFYPSLSSPLSSLGYNYFTLSFPYSWSDNLYSAVVALTSHIGKVYMVEGGSENIPKTDPGYTSEFPAHKTFVVPSGYAAVLKCPINYISDDGYIELRTNLPWKVGGSLFSDLENGVILDHSVTYKDVSHVDITGLGVSNVLKWSTTGTTFNRTNSVYHVVHGDDVGGEYLYIVNPVNNWVGDENHKGFRNNAITVEPSLPLSWVKVIKLGSDVFGAPTYDLDSPTYQYAEVTTTEGAFNSGFVESENNAGDTVGDLTIPVASLGAISSEDLPSVSSPTDTINLGSLYEKGNQSISDVLNQTHGFFDNVSSLFAFLPPDFVKVVLSLFTILVAVAVVKLFL